MSRMNCHMFLLRIQSGERCGSGNSVIGGDIQPARRMPAGLIQDDHRMRAVETAALISSRCACMPAVSHQGMTRPAPLPFVGQMAPKRYAEIVRWSCVPWGVSRAGSRSFGKKERSEVSLVAIHRVTRTAMRAIIPAFCFLMYTMVAFAQNAPHTPPNPNAPRSDGVTVLPPEMANEKDSPTGRPGPSDTGSGGAPAESPQGQTPPAMQAAPEGSSKTIVGPN